MSVLKRVSFFILAALVVLLYIILLKIDSSSKVINREIIPEAYNKDYQNRKPVVLISYADGPLVFFKNQNALVASAVDKGFDIIYSYRRGNIDEGFYIKNKAILTQSIGAGYWLWKPYFILKTMEMLPDNAIIFYADSGVVFSQSISKIIDLLKMYKMVLVGHGQPVPLSEHLKKEAQNIFPSLISKQTLNSQNIWAFFLAINNTAENRLFIKKWLTMCENKNAITDFPFDPSIQDDNFKGHQHDQALLSLLVANEPEGKIVIKRHVFRKNYGVYNFHRHVKEEFTSPLFISAGMPAFLSDILWNNFLLEKIRKAMQN